MIEKSNFAISNYTNMQLTFKLQGTLGVAKKMTNNWVMKTSQILWGQGSQWSITISLVLQQIYNAIDYRHSELVVSLFHI